MPNDKIDELRTHAHLVDIANRCDHQVVRLRAQTSRLSLIEYCISQANTIGKYKRPQRIQTWNCG